MSDRVIDRMRVKDLINKKEKFQQLRRVEGLDKQVKFTSHSERVRIIYDRNIHHKSYKKLAEKYNLAKSTVHCIVKQHDNFGHTNRYLNSTE